MNRIMAAAISAAAGAMNQAIATKCAGNALLIRKPEHQRRYPGDQPMQEGTVGAEHAGPDARKKLHQHPGRRMA